MELAFRPDTAQASQQHMELGVRQQQGMAQVFRLDTDGRHLHELDKVLVFQPRMALVFHMARLLDMAGQRAREPRMELVYRLDRGHVSLLQPDTGSEPVQLGQHVHELRMEHASQQLPGMGVERALALDTGCASQFERSTVLEFLG